MESLVGASRLLTAVVARSLARVETVVTTPQLRVLVLLGSRGAVNLSTVAQGLGVNPSNASRTCEQLVVAGLVTRQEDPVDRRQVVLGLTGAGESLVHASMDHRRAIFERLVRAMPAEDRGQLERGLNSLLATAAEQSQPLDAPTGASLDRDQETDRLLRWLL